LSVLAGEAAQNTQKISSFVAQVLSERTT
jgi:hypothetical protein